MTNIKMSLTAVQAVARLVKLNLSDAEIEGFSITIPQTLDAIDILKELDTDKVLPTSQVTGLTNVFADGITVTTLSCDLALYNAKYKENGLVVTEAVFNRS